MTEAAHPDQATLERVVEQAISLARSRGASAAEAGVGVSTGLSVTVRLGEVETLEYQRDRSLGVTVYAGKRKGSASTANLSSAAVEETVAKALSIASFTTDDEFSGLPDASLMAADLPDLDLCHPWEHRGAGRDRAREALRGGGARRGSAHPQFRGRLGRHAPEAARLRQQPRLRRRLSVHFAQRELRRARPEQRRHAARLLVHGRARLARRSRMSTRSAAAPRARPCSGSAPRSWRRARRRCCSRRNSRAG